MDLKSRSWRGDSREENDLTDIVNPQGKADDEEKERGRKRGMTTVEEV